MPIHDGVMRQGAFSVLAAAVLLFGGGMAFGQSENALFAITHDPATIKIQLQKSLPELERGVQLLQSASDAEQAKKGLDALYDSYRYLRAAQESSALMNRIAKNPDPMIPLRNERIWAVRSRLIKCRASFTPDSNGIEMCSQEATAALHDLRILLQVFP
jgi:hypothetical protein